MALRFHAVTNDLAGTLVAELPLSLDTDMTTLMHNFGTASFTLHVLDPACPENHEELTQPIKMGIVVEDEELNQPVWAGYINGVPKTSGTGTVSINCVSYLGYLTQRYLTDIESQTLDQALWYKLFLDSMNNAHAGMGIKGEFTTTGTVRTLSFIRADWKTVLDGFNEVAGMQGGAEYRLDVEWANAGRTAIKKTIRNGSPHVGTVSSNPVHILEYPGNISDFDYEKYWTDGKFATYLTVTGDGSGVKQVMSTPKVSPKEAEGFPRIEVVEHVSGVEYATDATALAESYKESYFNPPTAIQVKLDPDFDSASLKLGDSVRVHIDSPEQSVNGEVWRISGLSIDAAGYVSPTLVPINDVTKRWPLIPNDPTNASREAADAIAASDDESNPVSKGFEITDSEGNPVFSMDENGFQSFDPATGEWGEYGDSFGAGGYFWKGEVTATSFYKRPLTVSVKIEGEADPVEIENWSGIDDMFYAGDEVGVSKKAMDDTYVVITRIREKNLDTRGNRIILDSDGVAGYGPNALIFDSMGVLKVVKPDKEVVEIPQPTEELLPYTFHIYGGGMYLKTISGDKIYRYVRSVATPWVNVVDMLPGTSVHSTKASSEVYSQPVMVTIDRANVRAFWTTTTPENFSSYTESGTGHHEIPLTVSRLNPVTGDFVSVVLPHVNMPESSGQHTVDDWFQLYTLSNSGHLFVAIHTKRSQKLVYISQSDEVTELMSGSAQNAYLEAFYDYVGAPRSARWEAFGHLADGPMINPWGSHEIDDRFRVSDDGQVYMASGRRPGSTEPQFTPKLFVRELGVNTPYALEVNPEGEVMSEALQVQRIGFSGVYYVSGALNSGGFRNAGVVRVQQGAPAQRVTPLGWTGPYSPVGVGPFYETRLEGYTHTVPFQSSDGVMRIYLPNPEQVEGEPDRFYELR